MRPNDPTNTLPVLTILHYPIPLNRMDAGRTGHLFPVCLLGLSRLSINSFGEKRRDPTHSLSPNHRFIIPFLAVIERREEW